MVILRKGNHYHTIIYGVSVIFLFFFATRMGLSQRSPTLIAVLLTGFQTSILFLLLNNKGADKYEWIIFWISYVIKIGIVIWFTRGQNLLEPQLNNDAEGYWNVALQYYNGDFSVRYTPLPYIIFACFHIFGINYACLLLINVFLSMLMILEIYELVKLLRIEGKVRHIVAVIIALLPYLCLSISMISREPIYYFFIAYSLKKFYVYLDTYHKKELYLAVLATIPVVWMHFGYFPIPLMYLLISMIYNKRLTINELMIRTGTVMSLMVLAFVSSRLDSFNYISRNFTNGGLLSIFSSVYTFEDTINAGSVYLMGYRANNWLQVIPYIIVKTFYYLFSPLPPNWRGLTDVFTFFADSVVHIYIMGSFIIYWRRHKKNRQMSLFPLEERKRAFLIYGSFFVVIMCAVVFGLGTGTAGTAIRHRDVLVPIEAVMIGAILQWKRYQHYLLTTPEEKAEAL